MLWVFNPPAVALLVNKSHDRDSLAVCGGQGLNLVTLTGGGPVILQSTLHSEFESDEHHDEGATNPLREGLLGRI